MSEADLWLRALDKIREEREQRETLAKWRAARREALDLERRRRETAELMRHDR